MIKNQPADAGDARDSGSIPGLGRSPGVGNGNPLRDSCLENPMDRGAWRDTVRGVAKRGTWPSQGSPAAAKSWAQPCEKQGETVDVFGRGRGILHKCLSFKIKIHEEDRDGETMAKKKKKKIQRIACCYGCLRLCCHIFWGILIIFLCPQEYSRRKKSKGNWHSVIFHALKVSLE